MKIKDEIERLKKEKAQYEQKIKKMQELLTLMSEIAALKINLEDLAEKKKEMEGKPELSISLPHADTKWVRGERGQIRWSYAGPVGEYLRVDLLKKGFLYREILPRTSLEHRELEIIVPRELPSGTDYQIRLTLREIPLAVKSEFFEIQ